MLKTRYIPSPVFFLAVLCIASFYWMASWALIPGSTTDQASVFIPNGDSDYLPQIAALAHLEFGEASVREMAHLGVRSFPIASVLLHGILVRLLGSPGFVVAQILVFLLYGWALAWLLRSAGITPGVAETLAALVLAGVPNLIVVALGKFVGPIPLLFWLSRFPRPGVTEVLVLAFFILAVRLMSRRGMPANIRDWLLFGVVWACLLQADIYQAFTITLVAGVLGCYLLVTDPKSALRGIPVAACAAAICAIPFLYQRLHEVADVPRRWGVFIVGHRLILFTPARLILLAGLSVGAGVLLYRWSRGPVREFRRPVLAVLGTAAAISVVSGPIWLLVLGKGIQIHHSVIAAELNVGYVLLLCCGWIWQDALERLSKKPLGQRLLTPRVRNLAFAMALLACIAASVPNILRSFGEVWWGRNQAQTALLIDRRPELHYRSSFAELHAVLARPEFQQADVLGTFDGQLANWWEYRGRYLYLPDIFNTTAPDRELETRVSSFLHLLGTTPEEFGRMLENPYFIMRVIGGAKYQANSTYTSWPLDTYSPAAQARIAHTPILITNLEVPIPERQRLLEDYEHFDPLAQPARKLDLVILSKGDLRQYVHPERADLRLAWKNDTFEIWVPGKAGGAARVALYQIPSNGLAPSR
jgi:hypothetical protein